MDERYRHSGGEARHSSEVDRIASGRAHCALCGNVIRPGDDAFVTPDFLADESDPFWRFSDAPVHRTCFLVWDRRKAFVARYNQTARRLVAADGSYLRLTSEGELVRQRPEQPPADDSGFRRNRH
jgi:hypothetical protein